MDFFLGAFPVTLPNSYCSHAQPGLAVRSYLTDIRSISDILTPSVVHGMKNVHIPNDERYTRVFPHPSEILFPGARAIYYFGRPFLRALAVYAPRLARR